MPKDRKRVPISDDLAIYAQALSDYRNSADIKDLRIAILAQRLIIEKSKIYYRSKDMIAGLYRTLKEIQDNPAYCDVLAGQVSKRSALAKVWPAYVEAGLIKRSFPYESVK